MWVRGGPWALLLCVPYLRATTTRLLVRERKQLNSAIMMCEIIGEKQGRLQQYKQ